MSAWAIATVAGGALAILILVLLVVVSRAAARTAANAQEILVALEEVRVRTAALAELDGVADAAARAVSATNGTSGAVEERSEKGERRGPDGH